MNDIFDYYIINKIEKEILSFKNLDEIFFNFFSKDIVGLIYTFINPICKDCNNCCNICKINCYFADDCNRGRICCVTELERLNQSYEFKKEA